VFVDLVLDVHWFLLLVLQVRDVTHENTVRFVGACIDTPVILCLTEYCPKGSLKDVLENEELQLDWNFRMSLIHDVVKVMVLVIRGFRMVPKSKT
jgi:atrial natriuretic peptide receptor A